MMDEIVAGRHATPAEMELAHDAFSVAYVLVRSHADAFAATSSDEAKAAAKARFERCSGRWRSPR